MAFDRTNPTDLIALKSEVVNDPAGLGYVDGNLRLTLELLNIAENNLGNETGEDYLHVKKLMLILFGETLGSADQFKVDLLVNASDGLRDDISDFKALLKSLSGSLNTAILANTRDLTRAEVLFSSIPDANGTIESVIISRTDWITARDYVA